MATFCGVIACGVRDEGEFYSKAKALGTIDTSSAFVAENVRGEVVRRVLYTATTAAHPTRSLRAHVQMKNLPTGEPGHEVSREKLIAVASTSRRNFGECEPFIRFTLLRS